MRWQLDLYQARRGTYKTVCVLAAATYEEALRAARERYPRINLGRVRWRLYKASRAAQPRGGVQ